MSAQINIQQQGNNPQQHNSRNGNQQQRRNNNNRGNNYQRGQNPHKNHMKVPVDNTDPTFNNNQMNNGNNNQLPYHNNNNNMNNNQGGNYNNQYYPQNGFQNKNNKYQNRRPMKVNNFGNYAAINPFKFNQQPFIKGQKPYIDLKKTKMCSNFASGNCLKGDQCSFAHSETELKQKPDLNKTKLCEEFEKTNKCTNEGCGFAHGIHELRHTDDFYKTSLCFNFTKEGKCENGDKCRYAHGEEELKRRTNSDQKLNRKKYNNNGRKNKFGMIMQNQPLDPNQINQYIMLQSFFQNMQYANTMN